MSEYSALIPCYFSEKMRKIIIALKNQLYKDGDTYIYTKEIIKEK